jgi:beta-lactamase class A
MDKNHHLGESPNLKASVSKTLVAVLLAMLFLAPPSSSASDGWVAALEERVALIDAQTPGNIGVYVKHLGDGRTLRYHSDRLWYLASTIKVHVAVALLQLVEEGVFSLHDELTLSASDYVDGAGDLLWAEPGTRYTVGELLRKMLADSDSTATDMLIRMIGEHELNVRISATIAPEGFEHFTTILQVRYDAYNELHPTVQALSNMDFVRLNSAAQGQERLQTLIDRLRVDADELGVRSIEEAFERYYSRNLNSGTLEAFGLLLERLISGDLLSRQHTELMLGIMEDISTGDRRIKAGLPAGVTFAQKTGTQIGRACNVGIVNPRLPQRAVIVAACLERYQGRSRAEEALRRVGSSLDEVGLLY